MDEMKKSSIVDSEYSQRYIDPSRRINLKQDSTYLLLNNELTKEEYNSVYKMADSTDEESLYLGELLVQRARRTLENKR